MDLDQHLDLLGLLSIVMGAFTVAASLAGFAFATFATSLFAPMSEVPMLGGVLVTMFGLMFLAGVVTGVLGIVGGADLRARRGRGRVLVMIFAVLSLISVPVGTAYGVYALWVLTRPGVEGALAQRSTATP